MKCRAHVAARHPVGCWVDLLRRRLLVPPSPTQPAMISAGPADFAPSLCYRHPVVSAAAAGQQPRLVRPLALPSGLTKLERKTGTRGDAPLPCCRAVWDGCHAPLALRPCSGSPDHAQAHGHALSPPRHHVCRAPAGLSFAPAGLSFRHGGPSWRCERRCLRCYPHARR